jgi:hypothetical protein
MNRTNWYFSAHHYARNWEIPDEDHRYDLAEVNELGYAYAVAEDGAGKEGRLLLLLEKFHGYLMKYLVMVVEGTIPPANTRYGRESKEMLRTLAPRGSKPGHETALATCKMLHLAFKGQESEEIYDTLVYLFIRAARRYDPHYARKTSQVCEVIRELGKKIYSAEFLRSRVDFDPGGILRALARKGFSPVLSKRKKLLDRGSAGRRRRGVLESSRAGQVAIRSGREVKVTKTEQEEKELESLIAAAAARRSEVIRTIEAKPVSGRTSQERRLLTLARSLEKGETEDSSGDR